MEQMISMSINLHLFIISITVLLALYNLYATKSIKDEVVYINRMKYIQPQYLTLVSAIIFTGITVMAVNLFVIKPSLIVMLLGVFIMLFTSIKKHMYRKISNTNSVESMQTFRNYVKKKYIGDIVLLASVSAISLVLT
ncbi:MAG: hypothetical protein K0U47_00460 [Epsilonproteobacteria bacterium]|nr:hypothetical protein [Campylobacterota bacterium]